MNDLDTPIHRKLAALERGAFLIGVVGLAVCLVAALIMPGSLFPAYLVGFLFWLGISFGSLSLTMLHHLVGGGWGLMIRRPMESAATLLPVMALLFVPILIGLGYLYPWTDTASFHRPNLTRNYLNPTGFALRAAFYFTIWSVMASLLARWSLQQDGTDSRLPSDRLKTLSAPGLAIAFLSASFAAIDWMMSLEPDWYSSIYGAMVIVGFGLSTFTSMTFLAAWFSHEEPISRIARPGFFHDLGNLTLAFVMLWAYMAFSQFLIQWCGNLLEEIPWYLRRIRGGWEFVAVALVLFHFFVPFFFLLFRQNKRAERSLMVLAAFILVMHLVDLTWLVLPAKGNVLEPIRIPWSSALLVVPAFIGVGGIWIGLFARRLKQVPLLPIHDRAMIAHLAHRREGHHG